MPLEFADFYVIRVARRKSASGERALPRHDIFIGENDKFTPIGNAKNFESIEQAENYLQAREDTDQYEYVIQYCSREIRKDQDALHKQAEESDDIIEHIMQIPYQYRRTAYNWLCGRDVKKILLRDSEEVYQRHYQYLLDYDIDITQPSPVRLMKPKRSKHSALHKMVAESWKQHQHQPQLFSYPDQRPRQAARPPVQNEADKEPDTNSRDTDS